MKTLNDFKEEVAKEMGYENYNQIFKTTSKHSISECIEAAAERYAEYMAIEFVKHIDTKYLEAISDNKFDEQFKKEYEIFRKISSKKHP